MADATIVHGKYDHKWVNFQPCECGDAGPQDVFDFLQTDEGKEFRAQRAPWDDREPEEVSE